MKFIKEYWIAIAIVFLAAFIIKPPACPFLLGLLMAYSSISAINLQKRLHVKGIECTGIIVDFSTDNEGDKTLVIQFTTTNGEIIKNKPYIYSSGGITASFSSRMTINESVSILYDPDNPNEYIIAGDKLSNNATSILFLLIGIGLIIFGACGILGYINYGNLSG